jgi:protein-L-isoaspartate(D-aspartate) O-methyltransferase
LEIGDWEKLIQTLIREGTLHSSNVIKAMRSVPRGKFLPENMLSYSAVDTPLPIGFGQTASAPHSLVARAKLGETWFQS